jgi:MipA family protein
VVENKAVLLWLFTMNRLSCWLMGLVFSLSCGLAKADNTTNADIANNASANSTDSWFDDLTSTLYLGVGKGYHHTLVPGLEQEFNQGLLFVVTGELTWGNFFIETPMHRSGAYIYSVSIGYRFYQQQEHSFDLIASNYNVWLPDNKVSSATPQLDGLAIRLGDSVHGVRYQFQSQQHLLGVETGVDFVSHRGAIGRLSYSYLLPWRNLDLYLNAALTFETAKVVNYYYGVASEEVRPDRPLYQPDAGLKTHLGISAIYPLAEYWQLDGSVGVNLFNHSYLDSPLVTSSHEKMAMLMVRYVF